jgi:hypothetical protein
MQALWKYMGSASSKAYARPCFARQRSLGTTLAGASPATVNAE